MYSLKWPNDRKMIPSLRSKRSRPYWAVTLRHDGTQTTECIHHLVARAFIGLAPFPGAVVNHIDTDKLNNHRSNLEWTTTAGNTAHTCALGHQAKGEIHGMSKLTEAAVREIRALHAAGHTSLAIAPKFGVTPTNIQYVVRGDTWGHVR